MPFDIMTSSIVDSLCTMEDEQFANAWSNFFMNEELVKEVLACPKEIVGKVIQLGPSWNGAGWDTTRAAKQVRMMTGVAMVSGKLTDY